MTGTGITRTFRFRLTAGFLGLMVLLFAGFSLFLYARVARTMETRLDGVLATEANTAAALVADEMDETKGDAPASAREAVSEMSLDRSTIAIYAEGRLLAASGPAPPSPWPGGTPYPADQGAPGIPRHEGGGRRSHRRGHAVFAQGRDWRIARRMMESFGRKFEIDALEPADAIADDLLIVRQVIFFGVPLFLVLAGAAGYWMIRRDLAPLESIARQMRRMSGNNLRERLELGPAAEELALLAAAFNELLERVDQSVEGMRRFVADASHELRTPLAVIRGEADVTLGQERTPAEYRESLAAILEESRRLSRLVDDLLNLARADSGRVVLQVREFYFNELLAECCRTLDGVAARRGVAIECRAETDVLFAGDEELLRRLALNLLDNALRYTPPGGRVTAEVRESSQNGASGVLLRISDTGIGIPPEARAHVFERFFRADKARSRAEGGFGLGLSIVKWIAESHRGAVQLESAPEAGTTFTVTFPR